MSDINKRKNKKLIILIFSGIFLLLCLLFALFIDYALYNKLITNQALGVSKLVLNGNYIHVDKNEVIKSSSSLAAQKNIVLLDKQVVEKALMQIPWVQSASVIKQMPDILNITIKEHIASAYVNDDGLYDAQTRGVFYPNLNYFNKPLVKIRTQNIDLVPQIYDNAINFVNILKAHNFIVVEVLLDNIRCYRLKLSSGTWLILGRDDEKDTILRRLQRFTESFSYTGYNLEQVKYVDLRYDVGFALALDK